MNETIKQLRPIEGLFLISLEKKEVFNKSNALKCLIYTLLDNKNIKYRGNKPVLNMGGNKVNKIYESNFLELLKKQDYIALNNLIDDLKIFNQSLVNLNILQLEVKVKKFLFIPLAKNEITKTTLYYELQAEFNKQLSLGDNIIDVLCENRKLKDSVIRFYGFIERMVKKAVEEEAKKKQDKKNILGGKK